MNVLAEAEIEMFLKQTKKKRNSLTEARSAIVTTGVRTSFLIREYKRNFNAGSMAFIQATNIAYKLNYTSSSAGKLCDNRKKSNVVGRCVKVQATTLSFRGISMTNQISKLNCFKQHFCLRNLRKGMRWQIIWSELSFRHSLTTK